MRRSPSEANVRAFYAYAFLMDLSLTAPIWVLYLREERGFSLTQITLMEVPLFLLIVLAEVPTGAFADRFGRRRSLMLASGVLAVAMFVYGVATNYFVVLVSNVAWGLAFCFRSGADTALLFDSLKQAGREAEFQRINGRCWALRSSAALLGLLLGAPIAAATSYSSAITLSALLFACALPVAFAMHEPSRTQSERHEPYLRTLASGVREVWQRPHLRALFVGSGIVGAGAAGPLLLLLQPWLAERSVSTAELGLWQAPLSLASVLSALAASWLLAQLGERAAFFALPATLGLCCAALARFGEAPVVVAFLGIAVVRGLHEPLLAGYVNRHVQSERRATVLSVQNVAGNLVMAAVWPLAGIVSDALGLSAVFAMYACGTLLLGVGAICLWSRAERALNAGRLT